MPVGETVPNVAFPPETPLTDQVTAVLLAPVTTVLKGTVAPGSTVIVAGVTVTLTELGAAAITTKAEADLLGSSTLVAVTVTVFGTGGVEGAM